MKENRKTQAELLSPAGSLETLKAVVAAGADAVYCAGNKFGARAYANNFTEEELLYAMDYLHLHGKRLYLTVNTLLKEAELTKELYEYIRPLYQHGLDGVIVQDLGVLTFLREQFPGMELHASTQMTITGPNGARMMKELGCNRIVPARELSLAEIKAIHDTVDIEIESFIHGALCYCYSGQCLLSSMLGGRSGNRGRCAQPCRLPYHIKNEKDSYLLSPKDLCTIELLPQILESGVYSLKIEGRMKQAEYAAGVTSIYREYLERYLANPQGEYRVEAADLKRLEDLGSRSGFTKGYYIQQNGPEMMAMKKPAHTKSNDELQNEIRQRFINCEIQEKINGILKLSKEFPAELVLQCKGKEITVTGDIVQLAKSRPMGKAAIEEKMRKTGGSGFVFEALDIQMEEDIFIPVGALNQLRRNGLEALHEALLGSYRRTEAQALQGNCRRTEAQVLQGGYRRTETADFTRHRESDCTKKSQQESYLAISVQTMEQLRTGLEYPYVDRIYVDSDMLEQKEETAQLKELTALVHRAGKELYYRMPAVMRGPSVHWYEKHLPELIQTGLDGFVAGSYEAFWLLKSKVGSARIIADCGLYAWNSLAANTLYEMGADEITLPLEANEKELLGRCNPGGELVIYGYLPLMTSAQCVVKNTTGCKKKPGLTTMTDRYGKLFTVKNQCRDCYNVIYNTAPLSLLHQYPAVSRLGTSGYRISFTKENREQIRRIMSYYEQGYLQQERLDMNDYLKDFTNGHFKRGVE